MWRGFDLGVGLDADLLSVSPSVFFSPRSSPPEGSHDYICRQSTPRSSVWATARLREQTCEAIGVMGNNFPQFRIGKNDAVTASVCPLIISLHSTVALHSQFEGADARLDGDPRIETGYANR